MNRRTSRFNSSLQDFMENYCLYIHDLCRRKFNPWELRDAYLGGLESTRTLNNSLQIKNMEQATKMFPDIAEQFAQVYAEYMGNNESSRIAKKKQLFQFFLQCFLCHITDRLIIIQNNESSVCDIMTMLSGDDRRALVEFAIQKALAQTSDHDNDPDETPEDEITSEDSVSLIGTGKVPTRLEHRIDNHVAQCTLFDTNSTDRAWLGTKDIADLFGCGRAKRCTDGACQLEVVHAMVAAHEREHDAALVVFGHDDHGLHGQAWVPTNKLGQLFNRRDPRRLDLRDRCRRSKVG